jgi:hypothetical protein
MTATQQHACIWQIGHLRRHAVGQRTNQAHLSENSNSLVASVKLPHGCTDALRLATEPLRARSSSWKLHRLQPTELSLQALGQYSMRVLQEGPNWVSIAYGSCRKGN